MRDFSHCNARLWSDKLGQISLATTTLFWGVVGQPALHRAGLGRGGAGLRHHAGLVAWSAWSPIGTAVGAVLASVRMRLDRATGVIPLGIAMGLLVIGMNFITNVWVAAPFLILLGAIGGYLVVPMNALLQHRGHNLMGAGRSIAVQNFNEQACILGLGAFYTGMTKFGVSAFGAITLFGLVVAGTMGLIRRWHRDNTRAATATRSSACWRSRARTRIERRLSARAVARGLRWRWSSTPSSGACRGGRCASSRRAGLHPLWATVLIYVLSPWSSISLARPAAWRELLTQPALWLLVLASGTTNAAFNWAVTIGDVVRVVLLFYLMPLWAVLLARLLLDERLTRPRIAARGAGAGRRAGDPVAGGRRLPAAAHACPKGWA